MLTHLSKPADAGAAKAPHCQQRLQWRCCGLLHRQGCVARPAGGAWPASNAASGACASCIPARDGMTDALMQSSGMRPALGQQDDGGGHHDSNEALLLLLLLLMCSSGQWWLQASQSVLPPHGIAAASDACSFATRPHTAPATGCRERPSQHRRSRARAPGRAPCGRTCGRPPASPAAPARPGGSWCPPPLPAAPRQLCDEYPPQWKVCSAGDKSPKKGSPREKQLWSKTVRMPQTAGFIGVCRHCCPTGRERPPAQVYLWHGSLFCLQRTCRGSPSLICSGDCCAEGLGTGGQRHALTGAWGIQVQLRESCSHGARRGAPAGAAAASHSLAERRVEQMWQRST